MTGIRTRGQPQRRRDVEAGQHAVARDVGQTMAATPASSNRRPSSSALVSEVAAQPSTATPVLRVDPDRDPAGMLPRGRADEVGIAHRRGADDDAARCRARAMRPPFAVADAAAELHRERRRRQDRFDRRARSSAGRRTRRRDRRRAARRSPGREGRAWSAGSSLKTVACAMSPLHEADATPVLEVDRRKQDHGRQRRKLARSASPSRLALLGMELVPARLSRPTIAVTGPPWSVRATTSASFAGRSAYECTK